MICELCGEQKARIRYVTRNYDKGDKLLIIEEVPLVSCSHCGESYFTAETLHEIERIKVHRNGFAFPRSVPVATFIESGRRITA